MLSCQHCGPQWWQIRHEAVNNMLHKVLKFHSISSTLNPKGFPIPGKNKGGPDQIIYTYKTMAVDVSIAKTSSERYKHDAMRAREALKQKKYESFLKDTKFDLMTWVMDETGQHSTATQRIMKDLAQTLSDTQLLHDALNYTTFELLKSTKRGIEALHAK